MSKYWQRGTPLKSNILFIRNADGTIDWHVPSPGEVDGEFLYFRDLCNLIREHEKQAKKIAELNRDIETLLYYYNSQSEHLEDVDDIIQRRSGI